MQFHGHEITVYPVMLSCMHLFPVLRGFLSFSREMRWTQFAAVVPLLLFWGSAESRVFSLNGEGFDKCEDVVKKWASSTLELEVRVDKHVLQDLLFFLHVPRTGGRTYFHCFLRKLYPDFLECPGSYDKLRYDPRKKACHLFSTHDDYSVITKLPKEKTSVVTIVRDPIDRVFSAYEFSIEVAARYLVHPNFTTAIRTIERVRTTQRELSTLNIWPWKYLVPWMIEDLFARKDARKRKGQASQNSSSPYNTEDILMPLHMYINDPISQDIIHNGATFQIAGLTNNSYLSESREVRHCVLKYRSLGQYVLDIAKRRLDAMLYIGLTDKHRESTTVFAPAVGAQVISHFIKSKFSKEFAAANLSVSSPSTALSNSDASKHDSSNATNQVSRDNNTTKTVDVFDQNMTAEKLLDVYDTCVKRLRTRMSKKRIVSLATINITFTKEARRQVPEIIIQEIASLNQLDIELYKYAKDIFAKQQNHMVPPTDGADHQMENKFSKPYDSHWTVFYVSLLPLFFFLYVAARTTAFKMKP